MALKLLQEMELVGKKRQSDLYVIEIHKKKTHIQKRQKKIIVIGF